MNKSQDKCTTIPFFYQAKNYQTTIFTGFEPDTISPMCGIIDYFVDHIDLSFFRNHVKSNKTIGGRPSLDNKILLKIYLYTLYCDISIRELSKYNTIGSEFGFLAQGIHHFPKERVFGKFLKLLDLYISNIFDLHIKFLEAIGITLDTSILYADGTVFEAHNDRHKIITDTNVKRSNEKWNNVLNDPNSNESQKQLATNKLEQNMIRTQKLVELGRASYGRTDEDCVIMQDKNKSYIVGYNSQIIEEHIFGLIVYCHLSNKNPDSTAFLNIIDDFTSKYKPKYLIMDTGYGTPEIVNKLVENKIIPIVYARKIENAKENINEYSFELSVDEKYLTCPNGRILHILSKEDENRIKYKSKSCENCARKPKCCPSVTVKNKTLTINLDEYKAMKKVSELMISGEGIKLYSQRGNKCESSHGFIKYNLNGKKFTMNGLSRNNTILKLCAILYNLRRVVSIKNNQKITYNLRTNGGVYAHPL